MNRLFKQLGETYGTGTVNIQVWLDGIEVRNSTMLPAQWINGVEIPNSGCTIPNFPDYCRHGTEIFTWAKPIDFAGKIKLEIAVTGGTLLLTDTLGTYGRTRDFSSATPSQTLIPSGPDIFGLVYAEVVGSVTYKDPFSEVYINGVLERVERTIDVTGQWYRVLPENSTFSCNINVQPGIM